MDYNQISSFLDKFKKILFQKEEILVFISETIFKYTKFKIDPNKIKIKNTYIYIENSPIIKNEIFIYKNKILADLKSEIKDFNFTDIK